MYMKYKQTINLTFMSISVLKLARGAVFGLTSSAGGILKVLDSIAPSFKLCNPTFTSIRHLVAADTCFLGTATSFLLILDDAQIVTDSFLSSFQGRLLIPSLIGG
jgi:hypothetical protein